MKPISIIPVPLSQYEFAEFGDVLETEKRDSFLINEGMCRRYDRLSDVTFDNGIGIPSISIFRGKPYKLPLQLKLLERHPFGSQAFIPLHSNPFLIIVAEDMNEEPLLPKVFFTNGHQGINIKRNTWHGVLTPLFNECNFVVIDRIGTTSNLEEFILTQNIIIEGFPKKV